MSAIVERVGLPRVILIAFLAVLFALAASQNLSLASLASDSLVRFGRNGLLVLSLVPMVRGGLGLNFGLPLGILCGLFGMLVPMETEVGGLVGLALALAVSTPIALVMGWLYGHLLNRVRGQEMMIGTYVGFSAVALMCIIWLVLPFSNKKIVWPMGKGLRTTLDVPDATEQVLDRMLALHVIRFKPRTPVATPAAAPSTPATTASSTTVAVPTPSSAPTVEGHVAVVLELVPLYRDRCFVLGGPNGGFAKMGTTSNAILRIGLAAGHKDVKADWLFTLPTGLIATVLLGCLVVSTFFRTPRGLTILASGSNPMFARSSGIDDAGARIGATMLSTVMAAAAILVYTQSYGQVQLYQAPLMMAFPAVAALLIGGASAHSASIAQVLGGTLLFNTLLTIAMPVSNAVLGGDISEPIQSVVSNGMILYALTRNTEGSR